MAKIVFRTGAHSGQEVTVLESGITLGRGTRATVMIADRLVSGEHLTIKRQDGQWWAYDMNSSNGSRVNGDDFKAVALTGDLSIHGVGCQIDLTGPRNRTVINEHLTEESLIP